MTERAVLSPAPTPGDRRKRGVSLFALLAIAALGIACDRLEPPRQLEMPDLRAADYYWIASRIYQNETGSQLRYLTHWNDGEDFPSMGIGHFIWFPEGGDAQFDESFLTGALDRAHLVFFVVWIVAGVLTAVRVIESRRWAG